MANTNIDIGLAALCRHSKNQTLSRVNIAEVCGCSTQYIHNIERRALQKLLVAANKISLNDYLTGKD